MKKFYMSGVYDINNSLHRWLKYFNQNINEYELKELVEMDPAIATAEEVYRRYEKGEREIPVWAVIKLAQYYDVSLDYLLSLSAKKDKFPVK